MDFKSSPCCLTTLFAAFPMMRTHTGARKDSAPSTSTRWVKKLEMMRFVKKLKTSATRMITYCMRRCLGIWFAASVKIFTNSVDPMMSSSGVVYLAFSDETMTGTMLSTVYMNGIKYECRSPRYEAFRGHTFCTTRKL